MLDGRASARRKPRDGESDELDAPEGRLGSSCGLPRGVGGETSFLSVGAFNFTARVSKASPKLMVACATGEPIAEAVLTVRKAGEQPRELVKWTLSGLAISCYETAGSAGDVDPFDEFCINFEKIKVEYKQQTAGSPGEPVTGSYDVEKGAKP